MVGRSTVKSLENTYHFLHEVFPSELSNSDVMETHDHSTLVVKAKITGNRVQGSDLKVEAVREVLVVVVQKDEHER